MKNIFCFCLFVVTLHLSAQSYTFEQGKHDFLKNREALNKSVPNYIQNYFDIAIDEIEQMLKGEIALSFKRAVYLVDNAYSAGKINWQDYNEEILRITPILNNMIDERNLRQFRTAGNWAIFTFMSDSIPENNFKPYCYDFSGFESDKDKQSYLVANLLKTKKGNCRALPYLYKILADEVGVEAAIAVVPMHCYVKHRDEKGNWWNLEMTTGSFSRSSFIMETFNVSEASIKSGLYMKALSDAESVVNLIYDLLCFYEDKTGRYSGDFVKKCYDIGLDYYHNSKLQICKLNDIQFRLTDKMMGVGLKSYNEIDNFPEFKDEYEAMTSTLNYISEIGYTTMKNEDYDKMLDHIKENRERLINEK